MSITMTTNYYHCVLPVPIVVNSVLCQFIHVSVVSCVCITMCRWYHVGCSYFQSQQIQSHVFCDALYVRVGQGVIHTLNVATQAWSQVTGGGNTCACVSCGSTSANIKESCHPCHLLVSIISTGYMCT